MFDDAKSRDVVITNEVETIVDVIVIDDGDVTGSDVIKESTEVITDNVFKAKPEDEVNHEDNVSGWTDVICDTSDDLTKTFDKVLDNGDVAGWSDVNRDTTDVTTGGEGIAADEVSDELANEFCDKKKTRLINAKSKLRKAKIIWKYSCPILEYCSSPQ